MAPTIGVRLKQTPPKFSINTFNLYFTNCNLRVVLMTIYDIQCFSKYSPALMVGVTKRFGADHVHVWDVFASHSPIMRSCLKFNP